MHSEKSCILQICLSKSWGGLEMVAHEFAQDFNETKVNVITVCIQDSPLAEKLKSAKLPTVEIARKGFFSRILKLNKIIKSINPSTIICQHLHDLWFLIPVTYFRKIRTVGLSHTFLGIDKKDIFHTFMYRNLDRLICLTPRHRENLLTHLNISKEQFEIIPNMVDINKFNPMHRSNFLRKKYSIPANKKIISLIGRLDPEKGQIETIHAIKMLKEKHQDFHILIVGEDTKNNTGTKDVLKKLIAEYQLEKFVTLAGFSNQVNRIMASSDIILVPSKAETFGRIIIEAMASGTPVIATNGGGVPDIINHNVDGFLVPDNSPESLYRGILEALNQPELLKSVRKKALQKAHHKYSQQVVEKQLLSVLIAS